EVENSIIIQERIAAPGITDLDRVVAETLPDLLAGAEGQQRDLEVGARNILCLGALRARRGAGEADEQYEENRQNHAGALERARSSSPLKASLPPGPHCRRR